jgi:hypothetical protein
MKCKGEKKRRKRGERKRPGRRLWRSDPPRKKGRHETVTAPKKGAATPKKRGTVHEDSARGG